MEKKKVQKILRIIGYVICGIQLILSVLTTLYVMRLKLLPGKYIIIGAVALGVLVILFIVLQKWLLPGIITKFLSLIISAVLVMVCFYINFTYDNIRKMAGVDTKIDNVDVYVRNDDPAKIINDAKDYRFGILKTLDRENTDSIIIDIEREVGKDIETVEYNSVVELIQALYDDETQAIILNNAYISFVKDTEGFQDVEERIRSIYNKNYESTIKKDDDDKKDLLNNGDQVFTVLVNGVDTRGSAITNSNSDVNILVTVNMNTHQILMISTPRDYYIPLSISGEYCDKLTHSGAYGIDVTIDTLEMLYNVNIEDYVRINFDGFIDVIDALGGITVYSDYEFTGFDNDVVNMTYHFNQGYNELNGKQALLFARERHAFTDGDRQRGKNQMAVVEGMIDKVTSTQILKNYTKIWSEVSDCVITSMEYDEIADFVKKQLSDGTNWEVMKYSVTGSDAHSTTFSTGATEVYVMIPDEASVDKAKEYLTDMYAGKKITVEEPVTEE